MAYAMPPPPQPRLGPKSALRRRRSPLTSRRGPLSGQISSPKNPPPPGPLCALLSAWDIGRGLCPLRLLNCALSSLLAALSSLQLRHLGGQGGVGLRKLRDDGVGTSAGLALGL